MKCFDYWKVKHYNKCYTEKKCLVELIGIKNENESTFSN